MSNIKLAFILCVLVKVTLSLELQNDSSYFVSLNYVADSAKILDSLTVTTYDTSIRTRYLDSSFVCQQDTCVWKFDSAFDTTIHTSNNSQYTWEIAFNFSFYNIHNDSFSIIDSRISYTLPRVGYGNYEIDSAWGSFNFRPGTNMWLYYIYSGPYENPVSITLTAKAIASPDTAYAGCSWSPIKSMKILAPYSLKDGRNQIFRESQAILVDLLGRRPSSHIKNQLIEKVLLRK